MTEGGEDDCTPRPIIADGSLHGSARLLVVASDDGLRDVESDTLIAFGYRVSVASDAVTAGLILSGGTPFDLVVSELLLASADEPLDVAVRTLRSPPRRLFVANEAPPDDEPRRVLGRPFTSRRLLEAVRDALAA